MRGAGWFEDRGCKMIAAGLVCCPADVMVSAGGSGRDRGSVKWRFPSWLDYCGSGGMGQEKRDMVEFPMFPSPKWITFSKSNTKDGGPTQDVLVLMGSNHRLSTSSSSWTSQFRSCQNVPVLTGFTVLKYSTRFKPWTALHWHC